MSVGLQIVLALVSWLFAFVAPAGRLGFADRNLPVEKRRGASIVPGWPLVPLLLLAPMPFLGAQHLVMRLISWFHAAILLWAIAYLAYWRLRLRMSNREDPLQVSGDIVNTRPSGTKPR